MFVFWGIWIFCFTWAQYFHFCFSNAMMLLFKGQWSMCLDWYNTVTTFNPQATKWGHLWPRLHIFMCHLFISYLNYISYYEFVGLPVLHILVDFHRDPSINVAYIPQSLLGSFMTPRKKVSSYTLVVTFF